MGKVAFPKTTITLIVKGTLMLTPGAATLTPADEQPPPTGDLFYDDDPQTTVRYESDFAWFKPKADVLLAGHCHTPGGRPVGVCSVTFRAGPVDKTVVVLGDRTRQSYLLGYRDGAPQPFTTMALRYENSLGGPGSPHNPSGRGMAPGDGAASDDSQRLPNLQMLIVDRLAPAQADGTPPGFGPLGRTWSRRMALAGTYGDKWKIERWPWLPEDFDWGYFNAAPPDQQVNGYLQGDESLFFKNLHPVHHQWHAALPGMRVRCFLAETGDDRRRFREVPMRLDTLWADMDALRLALVWRGVAPVESFEAQEIEALLIVQEPVHSAPLPLEDYEALLHRRRAAENENAASMPEVTEKPEKPPTEIPTKKEAPVSSDPEVSEADLTAALEQAMDQIHRALDFLNLDPHLTAALKTEKDSEKLLHQMMHLLPADPQAVEKIKTHARQSIAENIKRHQAEIETLLKEMGEDPTLIDKLDTDLLLGAGGKTEPTGSGGKRVAASARKSSSFREQNLAGANFSGLALPKADFRSARLARARFVGSRLKGADFSQADLVEADFKGADLRGAKFTGADLTKARLAGAKMAGADLTDSVMTEAIIADADLSKALLARAQLGRADLSRCLLKGADLEHSDATAANLSKADLTDARLPYAIVAGADLTLAVLRRVEALCADFNQAVLTQADFSEALLEEANFFNCRCDSAYFQSARLARATFEGAEGRRVDFDKADLSAARAGERARLPEAIFRHVSGNGGNWSGAELQGAVFIAAVMHGCDFSGADLTGGDARGADVRRSVFDQALLCDATFEGANLFQTRLEQADLRGTNFRKCNLYGAEFLQAKIDRRTSFSGANLKDTKLVEFHRR